MRVSPRSTRTGRWRRLSAAAALSGALACGWATVVPAGLAHADCTGAGDFGAASGCPPPGDSSGSGSGESWPPTAVDWPPPQSSDDAGSPSGGQSGGGTTAPTPIVVPDGQRPAAVTRSTGAASTSTAPKPIVPVSSGSAPTPAPGAIVAANSGR